MWGAKRNGKEQKRRVAVEGYLLVLALACLGIVGALAAVALPVAFRFAEVFACEWRGRSGGEGCSLYAISIKPHAFFAIFQ